MYEGLTYKLSLEFPCGYPYKAPTVKFDTPIFHPNVDNGGNICLDILKEKWSALYDVRTILLSLQSLLGGKDFNRFCLVDYAIILINQTSPIFYLTVYFLCPQLQRSCAGAYWFRVVRPSVRQKPCMLGF